VFRASRIDDLDLVGAWEDEDDQGFLDLGVYRHAWPSLVPRGPRDGQTVRGRRLWMHEPDPDVGAIGFVAVDYRLGHGAWGWYLSLAGRGQGKAMLRAIAELAPELPAGVPSHAEVANGNERCLGALAGCSVWTPTRRLANWTRYSLTL
jgi:hypothetical protein